jgi:hypothetical protein
MEKILKVENEQLIKNLKKKKNNFVYFPKLREFKKSS